MRRGDLLALVQTDAELSEILMRAFILRRVDLVAQGVGDVVLIGSAHSVRTLRAKEFLTRDGHPHAYVDSIATSTCRSGWTASRSPRPTFPC